MGLTFLLFVHAVQAEKKILIHRPILNGILLSNTSLFGLQEFAWELLKYAGISLRFIPYKSRLLNFLNSQDEYKYLPDNFMVVREVYSVQQQMNEKSSYAFTSSLAFCAYFRLAT